MFLTVSDPVGLGFVTSLSHPGGASTGFANFEPSLGAKWLQLLKELAPETKRVGIAYNPRFALSSEAAYLPSIRQAVIESGVTLDVRQVSENSEVERLVSDLSRQGSSGLIVIPDNSITARNEWLVALTNDHRLPTVIPTHTFRKAAA